jgi:hypothetical protein
VRESERQYHTRFGWWVMTQNRGGAAVIGGAAALVLIADVVYAGTHWSGSFSRSFLITLAGLLACAVVAFGLRLRLQSDQIAVRRG